MDEDQKKIYGLERLNTEQRYYIVEGQIDSLFLPNAIAMGGSDADLKVLSNTKNAVVVFDNEPRNKQIVEKMKRVLNNGYKVVVWPSEIKEKDINDMVLGGLTPAQVKTIIDANTYEGIEGNLALTIWRRC